MFIQIDSLIVVCECDNSLFYVMCHVLHVMSHMSHFFFFLGQLGEVYRWRVCYQRGLPRLVYLFID